MALDAVLDDGATLTGGVADTYQVERLHAAINWETGAPDNDAYDTPGAPPNGGDFVRLMDGDGRVPPSAVTSRTSSSKGAARCRNTADHVGGRRDPAERGGRARRCTRRSGDNLNEVIVQGGISRAGRHPGADVRRRLGPGGDVRLRVRPDHRRTAARPTRASSARTRWTTPIRTSATSARDSDRGSTARTTLRRSRRRPATYPPTPGRPSGSRSASSTTGACTSTGSGWTTSRSTGRPGPRR